MAEDSVSSDEASVSEYDDDFIDRSQLLADADAMRAKCMQEYKTALNDGADTFNERDLSGRQLPLELQRVARKFVKEDDDLSAVCMHRITGDVDVLQLPKAASRQLWLRLPDCKEIAQLPPTQRFRVHTYFGMRWGVLQHGQDIVAGVKQRLDSLTSGVDPDEVEIYRLLWTAVQVAIASFERRFADGHRLSKEYVSALNDSHLRNSPASSMLPEAWRAAAEAFSHCGQLKLAAKCYRKALSSFHLDRMMPFNNNTINRVVGWLRCNQSDKRFEDLLLQTIGRWLEQATTSKQWQIIIMHTSALLRRSLCAEEDNFMALVEPNLSYDVKPLSSEFEQQLLDLTNDSRYGCCSPELHQAYHGMLMLRLLEMCQVLDINKLYLVLHLIKCTYSCVRISMYDWLLKSDRSRTSTWLREYLSSMHSDERGSEDVVAGIGSVLDKLHEDELLDTTPVNDAILLGRFRQLDKNFAMNCTDYELFPLVLPDLLRLSQDEDVMNRLRCMAGQPSAE
eukprot:TRINITY_DN12415_c4_g1_i1.p1 TRINITY_DN12415_c4_g1~~TRINITY_DN12415_c4_g1_i1.p1  ORF type:complete len:508 (+),score=96.50 TRINITY_DN12415_c4_g1_i1:1-1524(+)